MKLLNYYFLNLVWTSSSNNPLFLPQGSQTLSCADQDQQLLEVRKNNAELKRLKKNKKQMCDCVANCVRGCVRLLQVLANAAQRSSRIRPQVRRGLLCHSVVLGCCFKTFVSHCAATTQNAFASYQMPLHIVCKALIIFPSASCS